MVFNSVLQRWEGNEAALTPFMSTFSEAAHTTNTMQPPLTQPYHTPHRSLGTTTTSTTINVAQPAPAAAAAAVTSTTTLTAPPSPPRPALISNIASAHAVRVERGMVFDPRRMCWLKLDPRSRRDALSPSAGTGTGTIDGDGDGVTAADDDDDPFAGLDDLKDENEATGDGGCGGGGADGVGGRRGSGFGNNSGKSAADEWLVGEEFDLGPEFIRRQREEEGNWRKRVDAWTGPRRDALGEEWRWLVKDAVPTGGGGGGGGVGSNDYGSGFGFGFGSGVGGISRRRV